MFETPWNACPGAPTRRDSFYDKDPQAPSNVCKDATTDFPNPLYPFAPPCRDSGLRVESWGIQDDACASCGLGAGLAYAGWWKPGRIWLPRVLLLLEACGEAGGGGFGGSVGGVPHLERELCRGDA